jgi:RHS repeat-associated protein
LALEHAYNSLQAGTDGPLGFGWTHSYAASLAVNATTWVATVHQETGSEVYLYPDGAGGFEAPPRDVATLVHNANGSYTFRRCNATTMVFASTGELTSIADRNGYATTLQYSSGKLSTVTDPANRKLHFTWTANHVTSVADDSVPVRSVTFGYDGAGNLTDYTDVGGAAWHFGYDGYYLTTMRRPRQAGVPNPPLTTNVYDAGGRVTSQTDELNRPTLIDYTSIPGSTKITDPKGNITVEAYTNFVRTAVTRGYGTAAAATWNIVTDSYTLGITKVTDPNTNVTTASYDRDGNMVSHKDALSHTLSATYNAFDEPLTVTDANGVTTTYTYDANGNLKTVSTPLLNDSGGATRTTTYGYDPAHPGDVISVTDPLNKVWTQSFDSYGDLVATADPLGNTTRFAYDTPKGWLTSMVAPKGAAAGLTAPCTPPALDCTTFAHDAWGHVSVTTDGNGHQSTSHYDADGNLDYVIDADGNRTTYVYDAADQQTDVQRADATTLHTHYWPDGSLKDTVDGANRMTPYAYDPQGRLTSMTDPDGRVTTYGYDPAGNPVTKADPGGSCPSWPITYPPSLSASAKCTVMGYDAANRLTSITYSDGQTPNLTSIGYDNNGRRTSMTDGTGNSSWKWDSLGRMTASTDGAGHALSYAFANLRDPATGLTYGPGHAVSRAYDAAGRMTTETDWLNNLTTYGPDADSNIGTVTLPAATGLVDSYGFDNAGRLTGVTDKAAGATRSAFTYGRDNAGQLSSVSSTGAPADAHSYTYTPLNQLKNDGGATNYGYDAADNLTNLPSGKTLAYDPANQLCWTAAVAGTCASPPSGATTYSYDTRGNRTAAVPAGQPGTAYGWDQANRLTKVTPASNQGQYTPLTPARILDTRAATRAGVCPGTTCATIGAGQTLTLKVAGQGGVPATGAAAVVLSVVATDTTAVSYLTVWPSDNPQPGASSLNWSATQTVSNLATVKVAADGTIKIFNNAGTVSVVIDVNGWYSASNGTAGSGFNSLNPARILDTRAAFRTGVCPPATCTTMGTGTSMKLQVAGQGGVPTTGVSAVALNITVTSPSTGGYLTVWPSNEARQGTSSMNFPAGATVSQLVIAKVAPDGTLSIYNNAGSVEIIGDVSGWYGARTGSAFQALTPARILDTRAAFRSGTCTGTCQTVPAGGTLVLSVAGKGGVPATGASAVVLNVVADVAANGGYLTVWPSDSPRPVTSQLTYNKGQTGANATITKLAADGTISIYASNGPVEVIVDVSGYYLQGQPAATYTYNGDGLRTSKTVAGTTSSFTWDTSGGLPMLLDDGTNSYIYGPDGLPLEQIDRAGVVTWFHHDQLGSTRTLTSTSGAVVGTATYDAYGNLTASTGKLSPFGFSGEYTDAETGFVYLRARYYDPATGQFLSRDPLVALTHAPYSDASGNPLNLSDPSGLGCGGSWWQRHRRAIAITVAVVALVVVASFVVPIAIDLLAAQLSAAAAAAAGTGTIDVGVAAAASGAGALAAAERVGGEAGSAAFRSDTSHIFRDATGHFLDDTAANRSVIHGAMDPANLSSTITLPDGSTLARYFQTLPDGTQAWVEVRNGVEITNGGLNATPR